MSCNAVAAVALGQLCVLGLVGVAYTTGRWLEKKRILMSYKDMLGDKLYSPPRPVPTNGTDTSNAAAESIVKTVDKQRQMVFGLIKQAGLNGHICDEVEIITGGSHQAISARFNDLLNEGLIYCHPDDRSDRRPTRSGRAARVYRATEFRAQDPRAKNYAA